MKFLPLKYLLGGHRFVDKKHPLHKHRERYRLSVSRFVGIIDRDDLYDDYFMNWFCGLADPTCLFDIIRRGRVTRFLFVVFHYNNKLLRWVRYHFNFGLVFFSRKYKKFMFVVYKKPHLRVIINVLNGYLRTIRSLSQFYLWLKQYREERNMIYSFLMPEHPLNLARTTYLLGLIDSLGRFKIYRTSNKDYQFKLKIRFVFYMDLPATEISLLRDLKDLFVSPHFFVRSSNTIRFLLTKIDDCSILSNYLLRHKPFNRYLKIKFLNWYSVLQYLHLKKIKYKRKDRLVHLLYNFRYNVYKIRVKKKTPMPLPWYGD